MESARKIINQFLKSKYSGNELKSELFKAGEAAQEEGWTFMDASFQLGGVARDNGLAPEEVEQILRRAFSTEKRSAERTEDKPKDIHEEPAPAPIQPTIISPMPAGMFSMDQMLAMGLDTQSLTLLQNHKIDPEALSIPWPSHDWRKDLAKLLEAVFQPDETIEFKVSETPKCTAELVSNIVNQDANITKIMKSLDSPEGALLCIAQLFVLHTKVGERRCHLTDAPLCRLCHRFHAAKSASIFYGCLIDVLEGGTRLLQGLLECQQALTRLLQ